MVLAVLIKLAGNPLDFECGLKGGFCLKHGSMVNVAETPPYVLNSPIFNHLYQDVQENKDKIMKGH